MRLVITTSLVLLVAASARGELTNTEVLENMRRQNVAANRFDIEGVVKSIGPAGVTLIAGSGPAQTTTLVDRAAMEKFVQKFYSMILKTGYLLVVTPVDFSQVATDVIDVTASASEFYVLASTRENYVATYTETIRFKEVDGKVFVTQIVMSERNEKKLQPGVSPYGAQGAPPGDR